jgi:hypothetical protein
MEASPISPVVASRIVLFIVHQAPMPPLECTPAAVQINSNVIHAFDCVLDAPLPCPSTLGQRFLHKFPNRNRQVSATMTNDKYIIGLESVFFILSFN